MTESTDAAGDIFRNLFELAPDGLLVMAASGEIVLVNAQIELLFGYDRRELLGMLVEKLLPEDTVTRHRAHRQAYLKRLHVRPMGTGIGNLYGRHRSGRLFPVKISLSPLPGQPLQIAAAIRDISERHHNERLFHRLNETLEQQVIERTAALRASEARYRTLFDYAAEGILVSDPALDRFIACNQRALDLLGYRRETLFTLSPAALSAPVQLDGQPASVHIARMRQATQEGGQRAYEWLFRHAAGHDLVVELRLVRLPSEDRLLIRASFTDITEQRRKQQELEEAHRAANLANRAKSEFLANMSHEIRTPMNAVVGFAELLKQRLHADAQAVDYLDSIVTNAGNLLHLLNDILDLSRIEAGHLHIQPEPTDVGALCREVVRMFAVTAANKNLDLRLDLDPALPERLLLDDVRLRQILLNLVGNAIKFTPVGRVRIALRCQPTDAGLCDLTLEVEDTGIGIAPDQQERVFEAFRQQDGQSTRHYGGTGLGLAISRRLVRLLAGQLELDSQPGRGSLFRVRLPAVPVLSAVPAAVPATTVPAVSPPVLARPVPALVQQLRGELLPLYNDVRKTKSIRAIKTFAQRVGQAGETFAVMPLLDYSRELSAQVEALKIAAINRLLDQFAALAAALLDGDSHD